MRIWKYNGRVGKWEAHGGPYADRSNAEAILARLEQDEPGQHKLADKRPISAAEAELNKQARERKASRRRTTNAEISRERASQGGCVLGKWAWDRDRSVCGPDAPDPSEAARELAERRWTRHEKRIQARLLRGET